MAEADFKPRVRAFGFGAAAGFIVGAVLVAFILTRYGGVPAGSAVPASSVRADDGLAAIDSGILEEAVIGPAAARPVEESPRSAERRADPTATPVPPAPATLNGRRLEIPVEGIRPDQLVESFADKRSGTRVHEAIDIIAPRNTPVRAVEDGTIARLFYSKAGGITIYQFDPSEQFCYYYAHLERYADGITEGMRLKKGQVVGYVGTSGNAPKETPHLHFAVFRLTAAKRWWEGTPVNPYTVLR